MNHSDALEGFEPEHLFPGQSGVPDFRYPSEAGQRALPLRLVLDRETLSITYDMIRVNARVRTLRGDEEVQVMVIRVPDGDLRWEPIFVHGELKMVFGFVPDSGRRTLATLFRHNDTLTIA